MDNSKIRDKKTNEDNLCVDITNNSINYNIMKKITCWFCNNILSPFLNYCEYNDIKHAKEKIIKFIKDF